MISGHLRQSQFGHCKSQTSTECHRAPDLWHQLVQAQSLTAASRRSELAGRAAACSSSSPDCPQLSVEPMYFNYCVPASEVTRRLRSANRHQLTVLCVGRSIFGSRALDFANTTVCNSLTDNLCKPTIGPDQFQWNLKMYLFTQC